MDKLTARDARAQTDGDAVLADVLDAVRRRGASSRQDIAQATGLGRSVVAQRVGDLLDAGLLRESGLGRSTGGRPPRRLSFSRQAGHVLVGCLGATSMDVACLDTRSRPLSRSVEAVDFAVGPDVILERLTTALEAAHSEAQPQSRLWGIGIALPGPVEFSTGRPIAPPIMPGWDHYPIRDRLSEHFGVPVWIDNDVNALALGEWRHGASRDHDDVLFVKIGSGIGAGLILDGHLYRGAQGSAGDVGHIQVSEDPTVVCRCGNSGCLEAVAGGVALAREGLRLANEDSSSWLAGRLEANGTLTARDLTDGMNHGDAASMDLIRRCGHDVGLMLAAAVNFFNPSQIIVGGGVANAGDRLLASMRQVIYGRSLPLATRTLEIRGSALGDSGGVLGLSSMVLDEVLSATLLPRWIGREPAVLVQTDAERV